MTEKNHLSLSQDSSLPMANRYRHLAAHHILQKDLKKGCQALWASHADFKEFLSLEEAKEVLETQELPIWLSNCAGSTRFPASLSPEETVGQQDWAAHYLQLAGMAINKASCGLHVIVMNVFLGFYGFAVQAMYNLEVQCDALLPDDLEEAWAMVEAMQPRPQQPWENPWS